MADVSHERLSALAGHDEPGRVGAAAEVGATPVVTLSERRGLAIALLSAFPEDRGAAEAAVRSALDLALPVPGQATSDDTGQVLWQGPDRWLLTAPVSSDLVAKLEAALAGEPAVAVTDLGHARTVIRAEGPAARRLLAKEAPIDFAPEAFPAGSVAMTRFGHLAVTIHAAGPETLDVLAFRSFGLAFFEELRDRAAEMGYAVGRAVVG